MLTTIQTLLTQSSAVIESDTAQLDAELLLCQVLGKPRSYLFAWSEQVLTAEQLAHFEQLLARRVAGEPIAYIVGKQGFWSLDLSVEPSTLIPRADTETLVEQALQLPLKAQAEGLQVLDLGTGTGAIALALASERPNWQVTGVDRVPEAVALAQQNQQQVGLTNTRFLTSHWFDSLAGSRYQLIVSNPPYIAEQDPHLAQGDVRFEPISALTSGADGLDDIRHIIQQAPKYLARHGWLLLEHGYDQAEAVQALMLAQGFLAVETKQDLGRNDRITFGQWCIN
ncbi:SAM-dependent methyltransferase [Thiopseudomonas alkaliphila]|uniref:Release factor glutamine methyltransferase n=1 Tax=Thiopseudomonas alkaliphila TaxID=1697053 RepID=A0A0K1XCF4_9GAMM|nr:peptide chain release factor N(5)-glutamine methyltransferase [Thiopseudomonas alkaliphila]AKX44378.1 SAM-dependent methyltransferase [Thiopseudomonas alkaliphila]AKX46570.1 SAM-dependent methyltransferase [Thiopseudomonas alkaliphila]AKX49672.1 SAM-dependent methyltransferase [Thiopseudomonas alkaliphila]AKX50399.1 SAM-dependent methyltransferase [Thiopseudomonas alkaliphila]AKX52440.1 SAM-dependent methyltransferase [Thiopseudomonas alkaliphila]